MKTAAAIEDSRAYASPAHRWIGSFRQWSFQRLHNAPSIAPFSSPNNRNRLAILMLPIARQIDGEIERKAQLEYPKATAF
jgi:hypothetical protein